MKLVDAMKAGRVPVLVIHDANPALLAARSSGFAEALEKVGLRRLHRLAAGRDERVRRRPGAARPRVARVLGRCPARASGRALDRAADPAARSTTPRPSATRCSRPRVAPWVQTRSSGVAPEAAASASGAWRTAWAGTDWRAALAAAASSTQRTPTKARCGSRRRAAEPRLRRSRAGRAAGPSCSWPTLAAARRRAAAPNLPWLQETPDPVTKIAWQSWAEMSTGDRRARLGVGHGDMISDRDARPGRVEVPASRAAAFATTWWRWRPARATRWVATPRLEDRRRCPARRGASTSPTVLPGATDESGGRAWLAAKASGAQGERPPPSGQPVHPGQRQQARPPAGRGARPRATGNAWRHALAGEAPDRQRPATEESHGDGGGHGDDHGDAHGEGHGEAAAAAITAGTPCTRSVAPTTRAPTTPSTTSRTTAGA